MLFRQFFDPQSCTYTYLIASGLGREALIIDPVKEQCELYCQVLGELQLKLVIAMDTHTHADHITASGMLMQQLKCKIAMGDNAPGEYVTLRLKDAERINIDGLQLTARYTPGHTDDSFSYVMADRVFTGDTLLIRGTGRTDFQNGDSVAQYHSLFDVLLTLPDPTYVYPAHDYKGCTVSTIGEEKQFNPRLQVNSALDYAKLMGQLTLAKPKLMDIAIPANCRCGI